MKGWYDQQVLAWNPARSTKPTSSGIIATVVPVDSLVEMADSTHFRNFVPVAHVRLDATHALPGAVDYYQKEFNWSPAPVLYAGAWNPNELNLMELCFGNTTSCQIPRSALAGSRCPVSAPNGDTYVRWWLRVTAAGSGQVKYRCVTRRYHMEYSGKLPGTARWRWIVDDDTVWAECAQGCCQVERGDS